MINLQALNPPQRQAVLTTEGPVLVLAGAGSGKTRVITTRIAHLLDQGVPPERILGLTFTNKAAREMRSRLIQMVGAPGRSCTLSTFHALGVRFLREEASAVGLSRDFTILDEADQLDAVRRGMLEVGFGLDEHEPKLIHAVISKYKNRLELPQAKRGKLEAVAGHVLPLYQQRLRAMNGVDFDDLIALPVMAMESDEEIAARWAQRFRYVMVDEYQDTNGAQLRMVKGLVRAHGNLCVVGDDDQSIYAWRGAVAGNILQFDQQFPGTKLIALTQNYRSTNHILKAANHVISNNEARHPKHLWSDHGDGPKLRYQQLPNDDDEGHWIASDLLTLRRRERLKWADFAILYRTNAQSRAIEDAIRHANIPYRIVGGTRFYDRKEVRDVLAYLRAIVNPADEAALRRIINFPKRGIGDATIQRIGDEARRQGQPFWLFLEQPERVGGLNEATRGKIKGFVEVLKRYRGLLRAHPAPQVCAALIDDKTLAERTFYGELRQAYDSIKQIQKRLDNLHEIPSAIAAFQRAQPKATLEDYLATISLDSRPEEDDEGERDEVVLMTLHSAKGLEFPVVYLVGVEEGLMPHQRTLDGDGDLAEERRLAYVGITRAKRWLTLTRAEKRLKFGRVEHRRPSRFLEEIPEALFEGGRGGQVEALSEADRQAHTKSAFAEAFAVLRGEDK
ncbi:UvrD-helicase domain-containing protein [Myxococcota bacterium]|nr:UvrD-helicase domain-containing protein [Myxococcota bacterium]MBU1431924.1 UvrD-helicase domain-containing protein [Myxococcota bacterium]MBU1900434.1 UvrD-helicase domain-containing protein [Myxococcota bacterium]